MDSVPLSELNRQGFYTVWDGRAWHYFWTVSLRAHSGIRYGFWCKDTGQAQFWSMLSDFWTSCPSFYLLSPINRAARWDSLSATHRAWVCSILWLFQRSYYIVEVDRTDRVLTKSKLPCFETHLNEHLTQKFKLNNRKYTEWNCRNICRRQRVPSTGTGLFRRSKKKKPFRVDKVGASRRMSLDRNFRTILCKVFFYEEMGPEFPKKI